MSLYMRTNLLSLNLKRLNRPFFLCKTHLSLSTSADVAQVTVGDYLKQRHQFSPDTVLKLSSSGKYLKDPEKCDSVLSFFEKIGFSTTHIEKMVKRFPEVIHSSVDLTIKPKIKIFQDVGLSPTEIADIISGDPSIFMRSTNRIGPAIQELKKILGSNFGVYKLLKSSTWSLKQDLEKTMIPNIEFLMSCGASSTVITKFMYNFPRMFLTKPEYIKECVMRVDQMGSDRTSKMFLYAVRTVSSMSLENWERKLEVFRSLGFSEDDIEFVFRRAPHVFAVSERKIKEVSEVLLNARNDDISFIVNNPELLILSVEKTLKPRLQVLEILERKNLLVKKPSLTTVCKLSNEAFLKRFVLPYWAEVGTIYTPQKPSTGT